MHSYVVHGCGKFGAFECEVECGIVCLLMQWVNLERVRDIMQSGGA